MKTNKQLISRHLFHNVLHVIIDNEVSCYSLTKTMTN